MNGLNGSNLKTLGNFLQVCRLVTLLFKTEKGGGISFAALFPPGK